MNKPQKIQTFFAACAAKNMRRIREVMADDVTWTVPGQHPLAGTKRGVTEVLAFFERLAKAQLQTEPLVVTEHGDYVIDHHRSFSREAGGLDLTWCQVFRFRDGKIQAVVDHCANQQQVDDFFWKVYTLRPILARMA